MNSTMRGRAWCARLCLLTFISAQCVSPVLADGQMLQAPFMVTAINNEPIAFLSGEADVTYIENSWDESSLAFRGVEGVSNSPAGPFFTPTLSFRRGDRFYLRTNPGLVVEVAVLQETQHRVTLEMVPRPLAASPVEAGVSYGHVRSAARPTSLSRPQASSGTGVWAQCHETGSRDGANVSSGGSLAGGLVCGLLGGLIGTGIAYVAQSAPEPPMLSALTVSDGDCRYAYADAYKRAGKSKKQSAALTGGLVGTAVVVALLLSSSTEN